MVGILSETNRIFNLRAFGNDVLIYSFGQALLLAFGLAQNLIIPKYLSTADYGHWQLFLLYTSYVGVLHLGFLDGILVRWAGKDFEEVKRELSVAFRFILLEQFLVISMLALVLIAIDPPFAEIGLVILVNAIIVNMLTFFIFTAQAVKQFKLVTAVNISKGGLFLLMVIALFACGRLWYGNLYIATIVTGSILLILLAAHLRDNLFSQAIPGISLQKYGKDNISIGLFVLLGNFTAVILTTVDRLTVSSFFPITQFAQYTFAMSMCAIVIFFVQAVSLVFFPYLSGSSSEIQTRAYQLLKPAITIVWAGALVLYFPFTAWMKFYLPLYTTSLPVMAILLVMIGFSSQIQILHVNYFKAYRKQRMYFLLAGISLVCAVALYLLAAMLYSTLTSIAIMAVISSLLWYLLNEVSLRRFLSIDNWEVARWLLVIGIYAGAFLVTSLPFQNWIYGMTIYLAIFIIVTGTVLKSEVTSIICLIGAILNRDNTIISVRIKR